MIEALVIWAAIGVAAAAEPEVEVLEAQADELYALGRFADAAALVRRSLDIKRETLGPRHPDVAATLNNLAVLLKRHGDHLAARPLYEESLDITREALGPRHPDVATSLNNLAVLLQALSDYPAARLLLEESLDIRREALGSRHLEVGASLNNLAVLLKAQGDYPAARPLLEESLDITREALGPRHQGVAASLNNLAVLLKAQGDYSAARPLYEESLDIRREALGSRHPTVATSLNNLAVLLEVQGDYPAARRLYEESLDIRREVLGPRHLDLATSLNNLAIVLKAQGDYRTARTLYEESLDIRREKLGPRHLDVAKCLNNLATLLKAQGDYRAARPLYEESLAMRREALGARHPDVAMALNNLGSLLQDQGDYPAARPLYEESLDIWREALGPRHPKTALSLNNLGTLLKVQGNLSAARPLFEESLDIRRETLGPRHPDVAMSLNNLALLLQDQEDYAAAQPLLEESLEVVRKALGPRHLEVAGSLNNLALLLKAQGNYDAARPLYDESLEIWREALGPQHPDVATGLNNLASLLQAQGDAAGARPLRDEALGIIESRLHLIDALSEREALLFLPTIRPKLDDWLTLFQEPDDATRAWTHVLAIKGALAARARTAGDLARVNPDIAEVAAELAEVRRQRARLVFADASPEEREARVPELADLAKQQEVLERQLLAESASYRRAVATDEATPAAICEALPPDTALVDLLRHQGLEEPQYLAFVLVSDDCTPRRVELGPAAALEAAAKQWHAVLRDPNATPRRVEDRGRTLAALFMDPLESVASDRANWLVVPDGPLATIPFGALPTETGFVIEERQITYLDRANDVLREPSGVRSSGALLVGGVDYDARRRSDSKDRPFLAPCNGGDFAPLPGAAAETERVAARFARYRRKEALTTLGDAEATESAVANALQGKAIAHIATHGFFATGDCQSAVDDGVGYDPMLLSGLVLAGANQPADPFAPEDGILTASEVAACDLFGTELVVLSACETGLGELTSGQGVLGLRRAFSIAGVDSLVMSLWSVSDEGTVALMDDFYRRLLRGRGMPPAEALRQAQLAVLSKQREAGDINPFSWAAFIASDN